jgi:predicted Zn finger-like uncharacterized protein
MRVACPSCTAEYEVPDAMLAAGPRRLRCARCGHQFQAALPLPAAAPATEPVPVPPILPTPVPPPAPPPPDLPAAPPAGPPVEAPPPPIADTDRPPPTRGLRRHSPIDAPPEINGTRDTPRRSGPVLALAWLLSLATLAVAGWALVHYQTEIVEAWPPAARLYAALGLG